MEPSELYGLTDTELLERLGGAKAGSQWVHNIRMEMERRVMNAAVEASRAQIEAAQAAKKAAEAAKETAFWTRISAIAVAISVVFLAIGTYIR